MPFQILFKKTGRTFAWDGSSANILDFAESKGIPMESGCRAGLCGACKAKLLSGKVTMEMEDGLEEQDRKANMILPCVAVPESDVVIDA